MGPTALLPLRRKACRGFFRPKNSDGFGRVRTRELVYQRPLYISEFIATVKTMVAIVVVALAAHDTPLCHLTARRALVRDCLADQ
jgi:hypothetical protein